ncbi:MAG: hypothetical protein E7B37_14900, partial [Bradyrhizobium sp.]
KKKLVAQRPGGVHQKPAWQEKCLLKNVGAVNMRCVRGVAEPRPEKKQEQKNAPIQGKEP